MPKDNDLQATILGGSCLVGEESPFVGEQAILTTSQTLSRDLAVYFPKINLRRIPKSTRLALLTAAKALDCAKAFPCPEKCGLALAVPYASPQSSLDFMDSILDSGPKLSSPTAFSYSVANMDAGILSQHLGLHGSCLTVSQFEASFVGALTSAILCLDQGLTDMMLVGLSLAQDARLERLLASHNHVYPNLDVAIFLVLVAQSSAKQVSLRFGAESSSADLENAADAADTSFSLVQKLFQAVCKQEALDLSFRDLNSQSSCQLSYQP